MGILLLVGSIVAVVLASIEAGRAWGGGAAAGMGVGGGLVIMLVPFGVPISLIGAAIVFTLARSVVIRKVANQPDPPPSAGPPDAPS